LIRDAQRHGVTVHPPDVGASRWDCTLDAGAVRLGLRMVSGLGEAAAERIVAACAQCAFTSVEDLAGRAALGRHELKCLAAADALCSLAGHRRQAHWLAAGVETTADLLGRIPQRDPAVTLPAPSAGERIVADYASLGFTLGPHPLTLLRTRLARLHVVSAEQLRARAQGDAVRAAGLVTCRQRPDTASGVVFVTLEDETGTVNVVVWRALVERQRRALLGATLLAVQGIVERDGEVVHLMARRLHDYSALLGELTARARNFR
jgi:error-prone DNA polymerase